MPKVNRGKSDIVLPDSPSAVQSGKIYTTSIRILKQVREFLVRKWARELDYRLIKELWAVDGNRLAVRFAYEFHDDSGQWFRAYSNENWEFNEHGLMMRRFASINDLPIKEEDRQFFWPLGRRPDDHPGLSELGL